MHSGFCQKFPQAMDEVKNFFVANFQILGPLGCQGWVVIPQNVKKVKITAPNEDKDKKFYLSLVFCLTRI
jgi:hypothetical protein